MRCADASYARLLRTADAPGGVNLMHDRQQFVDTMRARVTLADRPQASGPQPRRQLRIGQDCLQMPPHLPTVTGQQVIPARLEEPLVVVPRRADERNAARQRLEGTDGR